MCKFSGDETGLQWEDCLFELQNAVEWRMVMSRGQDERPQMHAMSLLLSTCEGHDEQSAHLRWSKVDTAG